MLTADDLPSSDESSDDEDDDEDSDSDIVMPEGPRPDEESDADSDDSDDIPLPEGPPPPRLPPGGPPPSGAFGGPPPPFGVPPPPFGVPPFGAPPFPVPPFARPPRPAFNPVTAPGVGWGHLMDAPTPPQRRPQNGAGAGPSRLPAPPASLPAKPGSVAAAAVVSAAAKTTSAPEASSPSGAISSAPATSQPSNTSAAASADNANAATISAAPQLRDLRKETTVFVPRGVKRRAPGVPSVNATPGAGVVDADGDVVKRTSDSGPGLLGKLQAVGVAPTPRGAGGRAAPAHAATGTEAEDDYERFLEGLE